MLLDCGILSVGVNSFIVRGEIGNAKIYAKKVV